MKQRKLISWVLTLTMVLSIFGGGTLSAFADDTVSKQSAVDTKQTAEQTAPKAKDAVAAQSENTPPTLADGVDETFETTIAIGDSYNPDLTSKFKDAENDKLSYSFRIQNGDGEGWGEWEAIGDTPFADARYFEISSAKAGKLVYEFKVNDGTADSEKTYTVIVNFVDPSGLDYNVTIKVGCDNNGANNNPTIKLYPLDKASHETGFDSNNYDIPDKTKEITLSGGELDDKLEYRVYNATVKSGPYSYRAFDKDDKPLGGMTLKVPSNAGAGENIFTLRLLNCTTANKFDGTNFADKDQFNVKVMDADGHQVTIGDSYLASDQKTIYPAMVNAAGNNILYSSSFHALGTWAENFDKVLVSPGSSGAIAVGTTPLAVNAIFQPLIEYTMNVPKDAKVQIFRQIKNFWQDEYKPIGSPKDNGDGTFDWPFKIPKSTANFEYRASLKDHMTKAGWLAAAATDTKMTVTFDEKTDPTSTTNQLATIQSRAESSTLLNINPQNELNLKSGEKYRMRAYRAAWQIINSDTGNIMIEPDFHYNVVYSSASNYEDLINVKEVSEGNGNATGNWLDITAQGGKGTVVLEVYYDALDVTGTGHTGQYGATNPQRYGLVVINVGESNSAKIDPGIHVVKLSNGDFQKWDSEYDTVYFDKKDEMSTIDAVPETNGASISKVSVANVDASKMRETRTLGDFTTVQGTDGKYDIPIKSGNNVVKIEASDGSIAYQLVRGAAVTTKVENTSKPGEDPETGDTIKVSFDGLFMPIPKISGLYNPGFGQGHKITYTMPEDATMVKQTGGQYTFITDGNTTYKVNKAGENKFTNGHIYFNVMGTSDVRGAHRTLTDTGIGPNFSAVSTLHQRSILPDVTVDVKVDLKKAQEDAIAEIKNYKDADEYRDAEKEQLAEAIEAATDAINEAKTVAEVEQAVSDAKAAIDEIKTDAQLNEEEAAAALEEAQKDAIAEIKEYKDLGEYRDAEKEQLAEAIEAATNAINAAKSEEEVEQALADAKTAIDKIKTDAQLSNEEQAALEKAKEEAKERIDQITSEYEYEAAEQAEIDVIKKDALRQLKGIDEIDDIVTLLDKVELEVSKVKTAAGAANERLEKAKEDATIELRDSLPDLSLYRLEEQVQALSIYLTGQTEIEKSTDKAAIDHTLASAKEKLAALKTDAAYKETGLEKAILKVTVKSTSYNSANLTWNSVAEAEGYEMYRATTKTGKYTKVGTVKVAAYKDTKLKTGTTYHYKVKAYAEAGDQIFRSKESNIQSVKLGLSAPASVKVTAGKSKATIAWKKVTGASGYKVYVKKGSKYVTLKTISKGSIVKYTKTKLKKGSTYSFKVRAYTKVSGKTVYSGYSKIAKAKIK